MELLERVTIFCFAASYGLALVLEVWHWLRPRPIFRILSLVLGAAGLFAHLIYLSVKNIPIGSPSGSMLLLAFILAIFFLYGTLHHRGFAWGLFVLPIVLGLVLLALPNFQITEDKGSILGQLFARHDLWPRLHGVLLLLSAVGVCVGFIASVMYFVQMRRLRAKMLPSPGLKLMSLERLEEMNRRAILWAFPLLTAGLIVGFFLQRREGPIQGAKLWSSVGLWVVFLILMYLRYAVHIRGRQVALWTLFAFVLMLLSLLFSHGGVS